MPVLIVDHYGFLAGNHLAARLKDVVGLIGDPLVEFLAVLVVLVDCLAKLIGLVDVA